MKTAIEIINNNEKKNCKTLIVTKNQSLESINFFYDLGYRTYGENKLQSILNKKDLFPNAHWHFIGRIQSNKIKQIVSSCDLIHSVSTIKHLNLINKEAQKIDKIQHILLQFNLNGEITKAGFTLSQIDKIKQELTNLYNIKICGIMVIGDNVSDKEIINNTFQEGNKLFNKLKLYFGKDFSILSMGMSGDYEIAIANGSTLVRLGSILFNQIKVE